jgi:arylsulfatase A-like enzyme
LVAHYDLLPTLLEVAGQTPPADTDGLSYLPTLLGRPDQQREHAFLLWDFAGYGGQLAVRQRQWKGVWQDLRKNPAASMQLYDLASDVGETRDLAGENPEVVAQLEQIVRQARQRPQEAAFQFGPYLD